MNIYLKRDDELLVGEDADWERFESSEGPLQIICGKRWYEGSQNRVVFELQLFQSEQTGNYYKKVYRIRYRSDEPEGFGDSEEDNSDGEGDRRGPIKLFEEKKIEEISQAECKVLQKKQFGGRVKVEDQPANEEEAIEMLAEEERKPS